MDCCPVCRKPVAATSPAHPFCGKRCRWVDLGRWLEGQYRIPDPDLGAEDRDRPPSTDPDGERLH